MGKLVYELEAVFDEQGRAEVRVPDIAPGCYHVQLSLDHATARNDHDRNGGQEEPPLEIRVTGEHFKWHTWEWTGFPADHVFTREDFYDEDN